MKSFKDIQNSFYLWISFRYGFSLGPSMAYGTILSWADGHDELGIGGVLLSPIFYLLLGAFLAGFTAKSKTKAKDNLRFTATY